MLLYSINKRLKALISAISHYLITRMENEQFHSVQLQQPPTFTITNDSKGTSIFSHHYLLHLPTSHLNSHLGHRLRSYLPFLHNIISGMGEELPFEHLGKLIKEVIKGYEENKKILTEDVLKLHRSFYRLFLKHALCFISYLWKHISLSVLVEQLFKTKHTFTIKVLSKQPLHLQLYFKLVPNSTQGQQNSSQDGESRNGYVSRVYESRQREGRSRTVELVKLKEYVNNFKVMEVCTWILVNQKGIFYILHKEFKLGQGGFGCVYKAYSIICKDDEMLVSRWAVKELKREIKQSQNTKIGPDREHCILNKISKLPNIHKQKYYQNIIKIQQVLTDRNRKYIVYEYCPFNNLGIFMHPSRSSYYNKINKKHIFIAIYQLISTLDFIHYELIKTIYDAFVLSQINGDGQIKKDQQIMKNYRNSQSLQKGIIHRDLKPSNIMVQSFHQHSIQLKIIDWAFSKKTFTQERINTVNCGTDNFQAPQFDKKGEKYCCKVDVWAFGMIVFQILTGKHMISKTEDYKLIERKKKVKEKINNMIFLPDKQLDSHDQTFWKELLTGCLQYEVQQRWTSKEAMTFMRERMPYSQFDASTALSLNQLKVLKVDYLQLYNRMKAVKLNQIGLGVVRAITGIVLGVYLKLIDKTMEFKFVDRQQDQQAQFELQRQKQELRDFELRMGDSQVSDKIFFKLKQCYKLLQTVCLSEPELKVMVKDILRQLEMKWFQ